MTVTDKTSPATAPTASTSDEMSQQSDDSLLLLNYHLPSFTRNLWARSRRRVCADGGTNRLYDELPAMHPDEDAMEIRNAHLPDLIVGDLDSIRDDVRAFYVDRGCACVDLSHDQDTTDLEKCILLIQNSSVPLDLSSQSEVVVLGAFGGRLDHEFSHYHVLFKFSRLRLLLLAPGGRLLCTTIAENAPMMAELLDVRPTAFLPSIPHLVYQYNVYANYESERLACPNDEIPGCE